MLRRSSPYNLLVIFINSKIPIMTTKQRHWVVHCRNARFGCQDGRVQYSRKHVLGFVPHKAFFIITIQNLPSNQWELVKDWLMPFVAACIMGIIDSKRYWKRLCLGTTATKDNHISIISITFGRKEMLCKLLIVDRHTLAAKKLGITQITNESISNFFEDCFLPIHKDTTLLVIIVASVPIFKRIPFTIVRASFLMNLRIVLWSRLKEPSRSSGSFCHRGIRRYWQAFTQLICVYQYCLSTRPWQKRWESLKLEEI